MVVEGGRSGNGRAKMSLPPNLTADRGRARIMLPPHETRGRGRSFVVPHKKNPGQTRMQSLFGRDAPTHILVVILRVGAFCGVC